MTEPSIPGLIFRRVVQKPWIYRIEARHVKTGFQRTNHYQSVTLGNTTTLGFRTARGELLDSIDFEGKAVLDLGANLGELSRAARERGASLVDGFEYDPFFVEIAQAVAAHNGATSSLFLCRGTLRQPIHILISITTLS